MQHALAVGGLDRRAHRFEDADRAHRIHPALALQHGAQVLAAHQLHHDERAAVGERAVVVDGDD